VEADVLRPDRLRYRALRAKGPQAGWNKDDGVWPGDTLPFFCTT
jgi:hypothetical protein